MKANQIKNNMKYTLILPLLILTFAACKKNYILDDPSTTVRTTTTVPKLLKVVTLDTTLPTGLDTLMRLKFKYDAQNRVIEYSNFITEGMDTASFGITNYNYLGNDSLTYKSNEVFNKWYNNGIRFRNNEYDEVFYKYNNGRRVQDSTIDLTYNNGKTVLNYNYTGLNDITIIGKNYDALNTLLSTYDFYSFINKINGNFIYTRDTSIVFSSSTTSINYEVNIFNNTYTNFLNPIHNVTKQFAPISINETAGNLFNSSKNLLGQGNFNSKEYSKFTSGAITLNSEFVEIEDFSYILRSDNYPISAKVNYSYPMGGIPNSSVKILYFYE